MYKWTVQSNLKSVLELGYWNVAMMTKIMYFSQLVGIFVNSMYHQKYNKITKQIIFWMHYSTFVLFSPGIQKYHATGLTVIYYHPIPTHTTAHSPHWFPVILKYMMGWDDGCAPLWVFRWIRDVHCDCSGVLLLADESLALLLLLMEF